MVIYYVEDDEDIARSTRTYLEQNGYDVSVFSSIQKAKKALADLLHRAVEVDK